MLAEEMTLPEADERFQLLFRQHYADVHAYCTRRIGYGEADDVAAEVFAIAWRRMEDIEWRTVEPWLYGIARRVLANKWRSFRRRSELNRRIAGLAPTLPDTPETQLIRRDVDEEVVQALGRLRSSDREILLLAAWEELTASQIAGPFPSRDRPPNKGSIGPRCDSPTCSTTVPPGRRRTIGKGNADVRRVGIRTPPGRQPRPQAPGSHGRATSVRTQHT